GADAYRRMLTDDDMVDTPLDRLEQIGEAELARLQRDFRATAETIDPNHQPEEVLRGLSREHPRAGEVVRQVTSCLAELRSWVRARHLATIPSDVMPTVVEPPPYMRAT